MMITRKRQRNPQSPADNLSSKRLRKSSGANNTSVEPSIFVSQDRLSSDSYPIRAILAEDSDEFLIDWENDLITGETYSPSWQPKQNVSKEAIDLWRRNLDESNSARISISKRLSNADPTNTLQPGSKIADRLERSTTKPGQEGSDRTQIEDCRELDEAEEDSLNLTLNSQPNLALDPVVQISQHSSFDRGPYLQYHSSLSVYSLFSSAPPRSDSGLGESSPPPEALESSKSDVECIIPDSQSLPGSSSYRPTASTSEYTDRLHQRDNRNFLRRSLGSTAETWENSDLFEISSDPIQDSWGIYVAESPENRLWSQRSTSVPVQGVTAASSSNSNCAGLSACLTRSTSDPSPLVCGTQEILLDTLPGHPDHRQRLVSGNKRGNVVFDSENDQEVESIELSNLSESHSQSFSIVVSPPAIPQASPTTLKSTEHSQNPSSRATQDQQRGGSGRPRAFVIAEDTISQPTQSTESSALSERNPNSQTQRRSSTDSSKHIEVYPSEASNLNSSSLIFLNTFDLPVTLDSRPPPQAPPVSTMSQSPQIQMSASPVPSPGAAIPGNSGKLTMKEKLQAMRAKSRAEAPKGRANGRELGRSSPTVTTNEMAVKANQQQLANVMRPQPTSLSRPQSELTTRNAAPEKQASPPIRSLQRASSTQSQSIDSSPGEIRETSGPAFTRRHDKPSHNPAAVMPMESRIETQTLEVPVEVPLPLRVSQLDAHTPTHPSKLSFHEELTPVLQETNSLLPIEMGKMEFAIPLAMSARVRDQYLAVININGPAIHSVECDDITDGRLKPVTDMLARLHRITTHIDLDDPTTAVQKDATTPAELAAWAEFNSEKFKFLKCLLDHLRNVQVHIAIIARPGRLLDIVETFLSGNQVTYNRPDTYASSEPGTTKGRIEVSLIASGKEGSSALPKAADLVIALDESFNAEDIQVAKLRNHLTNVAQLAPVVHLLVNKSAEHIEKCISKTLDSVERIRKIVSCLTQISHEVGHLQPVELSSSAVAEEVTAIVQEGGLEHYWESFPKMAPIERILSIEYSEDVQASTDKARPDGRLVASTGVLKRALDIDGSTAPEKRQRTTSSVDVTQISDSVAQSSLSTVSSLTAALQETRNEVTSLKATHAKREAALKAAHNEREILLQSTLSRTQKQLDEYTSALSALQERYEGFSRTLSTLRSEKAKLEAAAEIAERRRESLMNENTNHKDKRKALEQELQLARTALLASPGSAIAELETVKAEQRQYQADKTALERKLESAKREVELVRKVYQDASNSVVESESRITRLEDENKVLQAKASTTAIELAIISQRNENAAIRNLNTGLESKLKHTEDVLRRKEEEIRELRRGRGMGTRGSSVKPGGSPRGSRGVSPVAGEPMLRTASKGLGSALKYGVP